MKIKHKQWTDRNWWKLMTSASLIAVMAAVSGCAALDAAKRNIIGEDEPEEAGIPDEADEFDTYRQHVTLYPEQDLQTRRAWLQSLGHDPAGTAVQQPGQAQQNKPQMTPEQVRAQMTRGLVGAPTQQRQYSNENIRRQDQGDQGVNIPDPNAQPVMSGSLRPQQPQQPQAVPLPPGSAAAAVTPTQPAPPPQAGQQQQPQQQAPASGQSNYAAPPPTAQPDANQLQKLFADRFNESGATSIAPQQQQQQQSTPQAAPQQQQQQQQQSQPESEPQARMSPPAAQQQARASTPPPAPTPAPRPPVERAEKATPPPADEVQTASDRAVAGAQMASAGPATDAGDEASIAHLKMQRPVDSVYVGSVQFTNGSDELGSPGQDMLRQVVQLCGRRGGKVRVVGHPTYGSGSQKNQLALARDRAEKVRGQLISMGVEPQKIVVEAKDGSEFRAEANNRAEIFID